MVADLPWRAVEPLPEINGDVTALLATIDDLKAIWEEAVASPDPEEFAEARRRSLRRHAIETGIIERLYDVDWGVTEAMVAEGLTAEVAGRDGGVADDTLAVIRDQFEALEYLAAAVRERRPLTAFFIRELHQIITRHQPTYDGYDQFGNLVKVPLRRGQWKGTPNSFRRPDGSTLECVPPEQVSPQMDLLVAEYTKTANEHPIIRAAWLHHRFILIHPFEDGNGRVARALTLLSLLADHYAPLVVDRRQRGDYLDALDQANDGDLRPLVRLFARLEGVALRAELTRPVEAAPAAAGPVEVAQAYTERLRSWRAAGETERGARTAELAATVQVRIRKTLNDFRSQIREVFREVDPHATANVDQARLGDANARYWHGQLVRAANAVDFYANLAEGSWWTRLQLSVFDQTLRYLAAVQKVGRGETGVLAVTVYAELQNRDQDGQSWFEPALELAPEDSVTLLHSDSVEERWPEVEDLVNRTLAAAVSELGKRLG